MSTHVAVVRRTVAWSCRGARRPWVVPAPEETFVADAARRARRLGVVDAGDVDVGGSLCAERLRALLEGG